MKKRSFGELELSILKIMRERSQASVRDVYTALGSEGSYTTIMTVMSRMANKGELTRKKMGKHYIYSMNTAHQPHSNAIFNRIHNTIFEGKSSAMISFLLETGKGISNEELDEIEEFIQKYREKKSS